MARVTILYWQEIPSVVEAREGRARHKELLSYRFQELIDLIAMKTNLVGTDEYLTHWRKGKPTEVEGSPKAAAIKVKEEIEAQYREIRKKELAKAVG